MVTDLKAVVLPFLELLYNTYQFFLNWKLILKYPLDAVWGGESPILKKQQKKNTQSFKKSLHEAKFCR